MINFTEIVTQVGRMLQRSGDEDYATLIKDWVNWTHQFAGQAYDYFAELEGIHNFSTVASTEEYFMPTRFDKPLRIVDLTNDIKLTIKTEEEYYDENLAIISAASEESGPSIARMYGVSGVIKQISTSGDTLQAKSSASENTNVTVRIEGYVDSALTILDFEDITVTGTSATTATSPKTFYKILHHSKDIDSSGYITLEDSSNNDLSILSSIQRVAYHKVMKLGKIPDQANSMRVLLKQAPKKLVDNNDYPFIDADDFFILGSAAYGLLQEKETIDRGNVLFSKANEKLTLLIADRQRRLGPDFQHKIVSPLIQSHRA